MATLNILKCCMGDFVEELKQHIHSGIDLNNQEDPPLNIATYYNSVKCIKLLIEVGADINIKDNHGETPLHTAVDGMSMECIRVLIEAGVILDPKDNDGNTPLHHAADIHNRDDMDYKELIYLLLNAGANAYIKNNEGQTFLEYIQDENFKREIEEYANELSSLNIKEPSC